MHELNIVFPCE